MRLLAGAVLTFLLFWTASTALEIASNAPSNHRDVDHGAPLVLYGVDDSSSGMIVDMGGSGSEPFEDSSSGNEMSSSESSSAVGHGASGSDSSSSCMNMGCNNPLSSSVSSSSVHISSSSSRASSSSSAPGPSSSSSAASSSDSSSASSSRVSSSSAASSSVSSSAFSSSSASSAATAASSNSSSSSLLWVSSSSSKFTSSSSSTVSSTAAANPVASNSSSSSSAGGVGVDSSSSLALAASSSSANNEAGAVVIVNVFPTVIPVDTGTTVTIEGLVLSGADVYIGGALCPKSIVSSTRILVQAPPSPMNGSLYVWHNQYVLLRVNNSFSAAVVPSAEYPLTMALFYTGNCSRGTYEPHPGVCLECPALAVCPGGPRVWPLRGAWNRFETDAAVGACSPPATARCCGGPHSDCCTGYMGEYCQDCAPDYYPDNGVCTPCSTARADFVLSVLVSVVVFGLLGVSVCVLGDRKLGQIALFLLILQPIVVGIRAALQYFHETDSWLVQALNVLKVTNFDYDLFRFGCGYIPKMSMSMLYFVMMLYVVLIALWLIVCALVFQCRHEGKLIQRHHARTHSQLSQAASKSQIEGAGEAPPSPDAGANAGGAAAAAAAKGGAGAGNGFRSSTATGGTSTTTGGTATAGDDDELVAVGPTSSGSEQKANGEFGRKSTFAQGLRSTLSQFTGNRPTITNAKGATHWLWNPAKPRVRHVLLIAITITYLEFTVRTMQMLRCTEVPLSSYTSPGYADSAPPPSEPGVTLPFASASDGNKLVLFFDPSQICYSGDHEAAAPVAWILLFAYCMGLPVYWMVKLYNANQGFRLGDKLFRNRWGFLYFRVKERFYYFRLSFYIVCFLVAVETVFIGKTIVVHLVLCGLIFLCQSVFVVLCWPMVTKVANSTTLIGGNLQLLSFVVALFVMQEYGTAAGILAVVILMGLLALVLSGRSRARDDFKAQAGGADPEDEIEMREKVAPQDNAPEPQRLNLAGQRNDGVQILVVGDTNAPALADAPVLR